MNLTRETLKRIIKEELEAVIQETEEFKKHKMYDPKTGEKFDADQEKDHIDMSKKGYVHDDPNKVEEATETPKKRSKEWFAAFEKEYTRPATPEEIQTRKDNEAAEDSKAREKAAGAADYEKSRTPLSTNMGPTDVTNNLKAYDKKNSGQWR